MRLMTNEKIKELTRERILQLMSIAHYQPSPSPNATINELQQLAVLQRSRTLAVWHDHSTVLRQGYVLFAVWVVYDTGVYLTEGEYKAAHSSTPVKNLQEEIEPQIHMIAPSASTLSDQLALVADRLECLQELEENVVAPNGVPLIDKMRFFCGDKPAQQFERGAQVGGAYKCGVSMQAKEETGMNSTISSIHKQSSIVSEVAKMIPPYSGSFFQRPSCCHE